MTGFVLLGFLLCIVLAVYLGVLSFILFFGSFKDGGAVLFAMSFVTACLFVAALTAADTIKVWDDKQKEHPAVTTAEALD